MADFETIGKVISGTASAKVWVIFKDDKPVGVSEKSPTLVADFNVWAERYVPESQLTAATARASELERELAALKGRRFPVHSGGMTVPWQALAPHEPQALANHGQTLERLASRGGLGWSEMLAVLEGKGLRAVRETTDEAAKPRVLALVAQRDTELAAMGERVAKLEAAARAVVAADTYPMPGKTRFEATTEAIGKLEALLPEPPALCTRADGKGET